jgi:hypothetical protein
MCSHLINKETQKYSANINFNQSAVNLPDLVGWSGDIIPRLPVRCGRETSPDLASKVAIALKTETVDKQEKSHSCR